MDKTITQVVNESIDGLKDIIDYTKYFAFKTLPDGTPFVCLTDDAPEQLRELVKSIHFDHFGGCMPNGWIYEQIDRAFDDLSREDIDDINLEADVYNSELIDWLHNPFALDVCAEYQEEFNGHQNGEDILTQISCGQWLAKDRIYHAVNDWLQKQKTNQG